MMDVKVTYNEAILLFDIVAAYSDKLIQNNDVSLVHVSKLMDKLDKIITDYEMYGDDNDELELDD